MTTVEYRCADGTPFVVEFPSEEAAAKEWRWEREHSPDPLTPMAAALTDLAVAGARRVYAELELPMPPAFDVSLLPHGFQFASSEFLAADDMPRMVAGIKRLLDEHGSALGVWHERCLPETKAVVAFLDDAGPEVTLAELAEREAYGQQMTMIPAYICGNDLQLLADSIRDLYGDRAQFVAYELTQGHDNTTLRADELLWDLGRRAADEPAVLDALTAANPASAMRSLRTAGVAAAFFAQLDTFLTEFGGRAEGWDIARATWREEGEGLWNQLAQLAQPNAPDPRAAVEKAGRRREKLVTEISEHFADDAEKLGRFKRRLDRITHYVDVREERALWQLTLRGSLRHALLRRGASLVDLGAIERADDVLYLLPAELDEPPGDLRATVLHRRADHERWLGLAPPLTVGGHSAEQPSVPALPDDGILRGVGAARGLATGPARVITDLTDADRFEPGDVLVCVMTAPPWTPLLGIAAALVVDTGDLGSHPAIAAREYGIPCVLATSIGTAVIPDGATVTVDGEAGSVRVTV